MKEFLTEAYDCPNEQRKRLAGKEYVIKEICLNIITATTLHWFTDRINESDTLGGFLGRLVYMPCKSEDQGTWYYKQQPEPVGLRQQLVNDMKEISVLNGDFKISDEAETLLIKWLRRHEDEIEGLDDSKGLIGFYARLSDYLMKFAMLYEISSNKSLDLEISEESMQRAMNLVSSLKKHINVLLNDNISFTKEGSQVIGLKILGKREVKINNFFK